MQLSWHCSWYGIQPFNCIPLEVKVHGHRVVPSETRSSARHVPPPQDKHFPPQTTVIIHTSSHNRTMHVYSNRPAVIGSRVIWNVQQNSFQAKFLPGTAMEPKLGWLLSDYTACAALSQPACLSLWGLPVCPS